MRNEASILVAINVLVTTTASKPQCSTQLPFRCDRRGNSRILITKYVVPVFAEGLLATLKVEIRLKATVS
jgi:hypothetical protein